MPIHVPCKGCGISVLAGKSMPPRPLCWDCFKKETLIMREQIDEYPPWLCDKKEEHKDLLNWLVGLAAEKYGYDC